VHSSDIIEERREMALQQQSLVVMVEVNRDCILSKSSMFQIGHQSCIHHISHVTIHYPVLHGFSNPKCQPREIKRPQLQISETMLITRFVGPKEKSIT